MNAPFSQLSQEEVVASRRRMVDDLLVELASRPEAKDLRLVETHISWVLLGSDAFKIKKPVTLPFVDFASFEARESACRAEVRINRRLAPRTYFGVVPIRRRADGKFTFGAGGAVVDWAVRMTRLDDEGRGDALLARGELRRGHVNALARELAKFHERAPVPAALAAELGAPDVVRKNVEDNFRALRACPGLDVSPKLLREIERWQLAFLRDNEARLAARVAAARIRDGHGDLRLEHVFFRDADDFEIIDGVEFDERLRIGDACSDVAFLAMDIARLGRVDLAERLLAIYARAADDFDLYGLVDFYESYRACVRAKISALVAKDSAAPRPIRDASRGDARRYLLLAESAQKDSVLAPVLVAVAGGIASGKSTIAEAVADELGAPVVDADRTRKAMLGVPPTAHGRAGAAWAGAYDPSFSEHVYAEVLRRAGVVLASGRPVVIDASFRTARARVDAAALARAHGVPFRLIECVASAQVCKARLAARDPSTSVSDATPAIYDAFVSGYEPIVELTPDVHVRIDTGGDATSAMAQLRRTIVTWPRGLVS